MQDSVFTKIIKGDIPCYKLYEDEKTFAFLTIEPYVPGHTLVVPKVQVENFDDLADDDYAAVFNTVRLLTKRLKIAFQAEKVAVLIAGFDVPHAHVHLMPVTDQSEFTHAIGVHMLKQQPFPYTPSNDELEQVATKINTKESQ